MTDLTDERVAKALREHRPVFDNALGLTFPVRCGLCDVPVPGWAAWDAHLADALLAPGGVVAKNAVRVWDEAYRAGLDDAHDHALGLTAGRLNPYRAEEGDGE